MIPVTTFAGKTVAVFGLGSSGNATALALMAGDAQVAAWDDSAAGRTSAEKAGISLVDLSAADWSAFAALILAPGVPLTHPEPHWVVKRAHAAGIEIIGDIELFCRERNKVAPDAPFIAITGTNGKSTTTALATHLMRCRGWDVQMGGNIGVPVLALAPLSRFTIYVLEMSSFQIDLTPSLNPTIGVLLNITPDHLDRHGTMENYAAIKKRLVAASDYRVVGIDDPLTAAIGRELHTAGGRLSGRVSLVSGKDAINYNMRSRFELTGEHFEVGSFCSDGFLFEAHGEGDSRYDLRQIATLRGTHNGQNACAAVEVDRAMGSFLTDKFADAYAYAETGFTAQQLRHWREFFPARQAFRKKFGVEIQFGPIGGYQAALESYPGLPHRMEEIGRVGDVLFINDSKATNADSTEKALLSFPQNVFWILGGKPKDGGIESLRPYFPGIAKAYLIGAASDEFAATLEGHVPYERCGTLDVAAAKAAADAAHFSPPPCGEGPGVGVASNSTAGATPTPNPSPQGGGEQTAPYSHPVILLSPACASYDQFANFEKRGDAFRALVHALPGFVPRSKP